MNTPLLAGAAEIDITPAFPVPLAGFAARSGLSQGVTRPLKLRAFAFTDPAPGGGSALLVVADILFWAPERTGALRRQIAAHWPVPVDHIILQATHTHSGPQTSTRFAPSLGAADPRYLAFLETQLFAAIEMAWAKREPATIERGDGRSEIGINRRVWRGEEVVIGQNPDGPVDRDLSVLRIRAASGETRAILAHLACHPTTTMDPYASSEFPGAMCADIATSDAPGAVVAFLQGCCGDINPRPTRERGSRELNDDDVAAIGHQLAADVRAVLDQPMRPLGPGTILSRQVTAALPMERVPTVGELERTRDADGILGEWSRLLLADPSRLQPRIPLEILRLSIGPDLTLLAMDAEVTMPYGAHIKERRPGTLPLPYSNGAIGYVVTRQQLTEGGYEPDGSTPYFGLPSRFAPEVEAVTKAAIDQALDEGEDQR
jgi:hypothetical protein